MTYVFGDNFGCELQIPYLAVTTMMVCFVFCLMAQLAVHSAAQFFRFYFVLLEFSLAVTFLGIFVVVISQRAPVCELLSCSVSSFNGKHLLHFSYYTISPLEVRITRRTLLHFNFPCVCGLSELD